MPGVLRGRAVRRLTPRALRLRRVASARSVDSSIRVSSARYQSAGPASKPGLSDRHLDSRESLVLAELAFARVSLAERPVRVPGVPRAKSSRADSRRTGGLVFIIVGQKIGSMRQSHNQSARLGVLGGSESAGGTVITEQQSDHTGGRGS